ncbi:MAG: RNA ligase (ATP) [Desulfomonile sp.]|jgi:RNA ligase (TIGR02306 family)
MRKLASVQVVKDVSPIPSADRIEKVTVLGWETVARRGTLKAGDLCVYIEPDAIVPERPEFEFLRPDKFRIRTKRMRGQIAQGIVFPLQDLDIVGNVGDDVTELLNITKYEPPLPVELAGEALGVRPWFVPKTDEVRIQAFPELLDDMRWFEVYVSTKLDGTSMSVYWYEGKFGVCSRNLDLRESETNSYWQVVNRYNLREVLPALCEKIHGLGIVIQGELCGPGIQKNRLGLKEVDWFIFNVCIPDYKLYSSIYNLQEYCESAGLRQVPISHQMIFDHTIQDLLEMAQGKYEGTQNDREGIVVRTIFSVTSKILDDKVLSFKVLNNDFLVKAE